MASVGELTCEELIREVNALEWVHSIDLGNGVVTPGHWDHNRVLSDFIRSIDFRGKKVLDIGCWDGLWSFEAEKRGASEVYATDLISHRTFQLPTFELAARALASKVKYHPRLSVYDIEQLGIDDFDIVLYAGVFYHIKDPLRAFSCLRRVMKEGALMVVEGAVLNVAATDTPATTASPQRGGLRRWLARQLRLDEPESPPHAGAAPRNDCYAHFYYRNEYLGDRSNWWVPTMPCLRQWVECNFFEVEREQILTDDVGSSRGHLIARAVRRTDPLYIRPEEELRPFDLNRY